MFRKTDIEKGILIRDIAYHDFYFIPNDKTINDVLFIDGLNEKVRVMNIKQLPNRILELIDRKD